jgi:dihydroorotate dehydrogenase (NAD+) catalytic subunit
VSVDTRVNLGGIALRNPVLTASGTFGYGTEFAPFLDLTRIGGFVAKSLTLEPRRGNPPPRIAEAPSGCSTRSASRTSASTRSCARSCPHCPRASVVVASVFETEIERYAGGRQASDRRARVAGIEVNASCPHVKSGGIEFGQRPALLAQLVHRGAPRDRACRAREALAQRHRHRRDGARVRGRGRERHLADQLGAGAGGGPETRARALERARRALGPAIRPIALRMVWQASRAVQIPICGMGGITSAADAVKFLLCGATAVQVGTQNYLEPGIAGDVADGLVAYAERHGMARLADLTGALELPASRR